MAHAHWPPQAQLWTARIPIAKLKLKCSTILPTSRTFEQVSRLIQKHQTGRRQGRSSSPNSETHSRSNHWNILLECVYEMFSGLFDQTTQELYVQSHPSPSQIEIHSLQGDYSRPFQRNHVTHPRVLFQSMHNQFSCNVRQWQRLKNSNEAAREWRWAAQNKSWLQGAKQWRFEVYLCHWWLESG